ncbi:MAG: tripartite tricarboxylate transporter substrate binding protein [Betaproteobacteria bacterium]|nr:MAG: tripartite tricarboxylate transporter substrate binding protein [Betaproteobacteria bacterium]
MLVLKCFIVWLAMFAAASAVLAQAHSTSSGQGYPSKPVKIIVPFPPGGSADASARIVAEKTSEEWKQPVLVENKPGAGTTIAAAFVASAAPDGHVLYLTGPISHAVSAALYKDLSYDAVTSFAAVARVASAPFILVVHPSVKANSVQELVELARARPGALTYASSGSGAAPHLAAEMLASLTGTRFVHVPFKGTAPALVALLGAQVDFQIADVAAIPHVRAGKLRALAVTTARRSALVTEIPTVAESGVPGFDVPSATGILAPAGTPTDVVAKINASINRALAIEEVRQRLNAQGFEPAPATPEEFGAFLASEVRKYAKIIREAGVRID